MARRVQQSMSPFEEVNLFLFAAWEHGARHIALQPLDDGIGVSFLGADGAEHHERLSLPYQSTVKRLREMSARFGRVHLDMGGHQWHLDFVVPPRRDMDRVFLHMRPVE
jgi:hypothetical protein